MKKAVKGKKSEQEIIIRPGESMSEREAPVGMKLTTWNDIIQSVVSEQQFKIINGRTDAYAIKTRAGGGGAIFRYVPHGYVRKKLNEAFGFDYDFKVLPCFNNRPYDIVERKEKGGEIVQYLVVLGELTIRLRDPDNVRNIITVIVKQDFGSQAWRASMEIGDALKAASSDALKRCGLGLGIALDLYFDDEAALNHWTKQQMKKFDAAAKPGDAMELLSRAATELSMDAEEIEKVASTSIDELMLLEPAAIGEVWDKLKAAKK